MSELIVYLSGRRAGRLIRKDNGNLRFRYDPGYSTRFIRTTTNSMIERTINEAGRLSAEPWHDNPTAKAIYASIYAHGTP